MRIFPAANTGYIAKAGLALACVFLWAAGTAPAFAEATVTYAPQTYSPSPAGAAALAGIDSAAQLSQQYINQQNAYAQAMQAMQAMQASQAQGSSNPSAMSILDMEKEKKAAEQERQRQIDLGSANDPNSARYKSEQLAKQAAKDREQTKELGRSDNDIEQMPPPEVETLQKINESMGGAGMTLSDNPVSREISLDLRKEAQKEAALSYGARGGLAKRNYEITQRMKDFDPVLDKVFNFRSLLIRAPSGMLIEPPIVKESINDLVITKGGDEAAVANEVFDINKKAKIVSAPRDWREYLIQPWTDVPPPPKILWPKNAQEQANWNVWVSQGWKAGLEQADQIFESNTNRLVADYSGMVRYKMLLAQNMISEPYALHEDRGVTGGKNQMRVGDRALRITGPSQFLMGADLWKPADR